MAEYLDKERFLQSMGLLGDETKYGNRDGEHQSRSYGTWMGYEIMDSVEYSIVEEDVVPVVRCKDCKYFVQADEKYQDHCRLYGAMITEGDFCSAGERREETK